MTTTGSTPSGDHGRASIPALVGQAISLVKQLVSAQLQLFKLQLKRIGKKAGAAAGGFIIALVLLALLPLWIFHTVELAFMLIVPQWAASLITIAIIVVLAVIFFVIGVKMAKKAASEAQGTRDQMKDEFEAVKEGITK